jgi:site-specific DNA-methyltransferase (adenine-specific)
MEQMINSSSEAEINNVQPHLHKTLCCTLPFVQLWNEDCIKTLERIETGSVDLLLQDTPFGCTQNEWDIKPNFTIMWQHWERVIKDNGAMIFFGTQPFASELILSRSAFFRYDLIWQKSHATGFLNAQKMPLRIHEHILVFYKMQPTYKPQIFDKPKQNIRPITTKPRLSDNYGKFKEGNTRTISIDKSYPDSVLYFHNESKTETNHPTQKPLDLIRYLINTYSNENDVVFDGYSGSGTTAAACIKERRNFIGSELNKEYFDLSVKRLTEISMKPELELR